MYIKIDKRKLLTFIKLGIIVLAMFLVVGGIIKLGRGVTASVAVSAGTRKLPIYCVQTDEKKVSISFDAAWGNEDTPDILAVLKEYNVKATFFMTGGWMEKYPNDVKAIAEGGHDLGNHSENHKQMSQLSADQCRSELTKPHDRIKELTGLEMNLFRPPYGDYNNTLLDTTKEIEYYCIQWDVDSLDWKDYGVESMIKTVCEHKHLGNGSIILMHNGAKHTAAALPRIIEGLQAKGYTLVPISELIHTGEYTIDHEGRQHPKE